MSKTVVIGSNPIGFNSGKVAVKIGNKTYDKDLNEIPKDGGPMTRQRKRLQERKQAKKDKAMEKVWNKLSKIKN